MAAPATALRYSYVFRDAKGQTARMRVMIGDATVTAINTDANNGLTLLQACSNAFVSVPQDYHKLHTYGTNATYANVEDKAQLTFISQQGTIVRFQLPAPKAASFNTDGETVLASETNIGPLLVWFTTYVYENITDSSALSYVGGIRVRRRFQRRFNIFTKDPTLGGEGE